MKILYLLNNFSIGGAEMGLVHLLRQGFFSGMELEIAVLFEGTGKLRPMLQQAGYTGEAIALMPQQDMTVPLLFKAYGKLAKLLRKSRPDMLLLSLPQANILGRIAAQRHKRMKVVTFEHTARFGKPYYGTLLKLTSPRVDAVLYDCAVTGDAMQVYYSGKKRLRHYVPLTSIPAERTVKEEYLLHPIPAILSVGRLSTPKNYPEAIRAIGLLVERGHAVHYYIAGEGELRGELEDLTRALGLGEHVTFLGFTDWRPWRLKADIFLQASLWEGLCISAIEAMGAGMPVVATDVGGIRDYGRNGHNMLKPLGSGASSIADALEKMLVSEDFRREIGTHAKEDILSRFGTETVARQLREAAESLISMVGENA